MHGHHVGRPLFAERVTRYTTAVEAPQRAHVPGLALEKDARWIAGERHPWALIVGHYVSLRHLTSSDVSYRFRR
jgi:hypothetical protein